jgi:hypothetical protein
VNFLKTIIIKALVVNRKSCGVEHPKLIEVLCSDFFDLTAIEGKLSGYNACFFCLGISSVGVGKENYYHITYDLTLNFAKALVKQNKGMTFIRGRYCHDQFSYRWV